MTVVTLPPLQKGWFRGTMTLVSLTPDKRKVTGNKMMAFADTNRWEAAKFGLAKMMEEAMDRGELWPNHHHIELRVTDDRGITVEAVSLLRDGFYERR